MRYNRTLMLTLVFLGGCSEPGAETLSVAARPDPQRPPARFVDVTEESGLRFLHTNGMTPQKFLPETLGSGVGIFDFDDDGHLDVFLVNGRSWTPDSGSPSSALFRGTGDGRFEDVSESVGLDFVRQGMGCSMGDADGDGDDDVFVTAVDGNVFLRNDGGRQLVDATREAGLTSRTWAAPDGRLVPEWSTASAWFDADNDGDLDLFVCNYCRWAPELEIFTSLDGVHKVFSTPDRYEGLPCRLFLNDGNGRFSEGPGRERLEECLGKGLGVALWDFDDNGLVDVVVANDTRPNFLFLNRGHGVFEEAGVTTGIAYDEHGRARAGMGIDVAWLQPVGAAVVTIGNFAGEPLSFYAWSVGDSGRRGGFEDVAKRWGLDDAALVPLTFGLMFADFDLDGWQDLVLANGHIEPDIDQFARGQTYGQPLLKFQGGANGFVDVSNAAGDAPAVPRVGRGLARGDLDNDGDPDLVLTTNGGAAVVLRNESRPGDGVRVGRVRLVGRRGNPHAIGARVILSWDGREQVRMVATGSSYSSQSETTLTFGLGRTGSAGLVTVHWPDGETTRTQVTQDPNEWLIPRDP